VTRLVSTPPVLRTKDFDFVSVVLAYQLASPVAFQNRGIGRHADQVPLVEGLESL